MTLYREEFICVYVGCFLWKESLEYKDCSTSTTARNQETASGSFTIWCFVLVHAYFRKVGNHSGMNKKTNFCKIRAIRRYHREICYATPD